MDEPMAFVGVPRPIVEGMARNDMPPPGGGRLRLDMSLNVWTLVALLFVLIVAGLLIDRLHTEQGIQGSQLKQMTEQQAITNRRLLNMETDGALLRQDLRSFPLHRHVGSSRLEVFPPKHDYYPWDKEDK